MASRVLEAGSIVTRTRHLLLSRVLKERPLWLDVVEAFPPVEPVPPHKAKQLFPGRARVLTYSEDCLKKEFSRRYVVVSKAGHKPANEILSLYEGRRSNQLNLTDQFVQEQLKGISLGKNKQDAAVDALRAVRDSHPSLTIISKEEQRETADRETAVTHLEQTVLDVLNTVD